MEENEKEKQQSSSKNTESYKFHKNWSRPPIWLWMVIVFTIYQCSGLYQKFHHSDKSCFWIIPVRYWHLTLTLTIGSVFVNYQAWLCWPTILTSNHFIILTIPAMYLVYFGLWRIFFVFLNSCIERCLETCFEPVLLLVNMAKLT